MSICVRQSDLFDIHSINWYWKDMENGHKWCWKVMETTFVFFVHTLVCTFCELRCVTAVKEETRDWIL